MHPSFIRTVQTSRWLSIQQHQYNSLHFEQETLPNGSEKSPSVPWLIYIHLAHLQYKTLAELLWTCLGISWCLQKIIWKEGKKQQKKPRQGLWSTTSVRKSQQDARTIDPPFSWPFPMVPSRLRCHSDNGDRRFFRPPVSCCSHYPMQSDSPCSGRGGVTAWILTFRILWDSEHILNYIAVSEDAV